MPFSRLTPGERHERNAMSAYYTSFYHHPWQEFADEILLTLRDRVDLRPSFWKSKKKFLRNPDGLLIMNEPGDILSLRVVEAKTSLRKVRV